MYYKGVTGTLRELTRAKETGHIPNAAGFHKGENS